MKANWSKKTISEAIVERDYGITEINPVASDPPNFMNAMPVKIRSVVCDGMLMGVELGDSRLDPGDPVRQNGYCRIGEHQLAKVVSLLADIIEENNARRADDHTESAPTRTQPERGEAAPLGQEVEGG